MQAEGFWYKEGQLFELDGGTHIKHVIANLSVFHLDNEKVIEVFNKYCERIGSEGKAREEIIRLVTQNGWIRIRHYLKPDYWSIQFDSYNERIEELHLLFRILTERKIIQEDAEVIFTGFFDGTMKRYPFCEGGIKHFLKHE